MGWDLYTKVNAKIASCYVCNHWHNTSGLSAMLNELSWKSLARQRDIARLCKMYKAVHGLMEIPWLQNKVLIPNPDCN